MKKKIVLWGTGAQDEKLLVALELLDKENKVNIYTFDESLATEEFYKDMMNKWREGVEIPFPEGHEKIEKELSVTTDLLPEHIKVERTDLINRAKTEWHFVVLSTKLSEIYHSELEDLKEKIHSLSEYDDKLWNEMKNFWSKVQSQVRDKNLFREHANSLRKKTNSLFDKLKELKNAFEEEFKKVSQNSANGILSELAVIEEKIEKGLGLKPLFEELKDLQAKFKNSKFTREDRSKVWNKIDGAFKTIKEKRFGSSKEQDTALSRIERRYNGLLSAIEKMQRSIDRDKQDKIFQDKRISQSDGQLEAQIRQAKVSMIEERIRSKEEKLADMLKTKAELEKKVEQEKARQTKKEEIKKAKEMAKQKIAEEMKEAEKERSSDAEKLEEAASKLKENLKKPEKEASEPAKDDGEASDQSSGESTEDSGEEKKEEKQSDSLIDAITTTVGEALEDVTDTVKAVVDVVGKKVEEKKEDLKKNIDELKDEEDDSILESIGKKVSSTVEDVVDSVKEMADKFEEKKEEKKEETTEEKSEGENEEEKSGIDGIGEKLANVIEETMDLATDLAGVVGDKIEDLVDKVTEEEE